MWPFIHPGAATLIAYADGELGPERTWRVQRHTEMCDRCRGELDQIHQERVLLSRNMAAGAVDQEAVARSRAAVMAAIGAWQDGSSGVDEHLRGRIGAELQLYFGAGTASKVLQSTPSGELVSRAQYLLAMFLGRRSAATIIAEAVAGAASVGVGPQVC
jgi:anti-sigma factor RsiW